MGTVKKNSKLFILHGWTYSAEKWKPFLKLLKQNNIKYELLKIPGLTAPLNDVWTLNDYINWLKDKIDEYGGNLTLLGHSNGGRIASAYTASYPNRVERLILIDSAGIDHGSFGASFKKIFFKTGAKIAARFTKSNLARDFFYKIIGEEDYNRADEHLKKTLVNLISEDLSQTFKKIKVPALIIWGKNDKITPVSDAKTMHSLIKNSELQIIPGASHSPQFTHPRKVLDIILNSLIGHHTL